MKKLIVLFFMSVFLYADDMEIDFGKVAMDGVIEGMNAGIDMYKKSITNNKLLKKINTVNEAEKESNKFSNLKIYGKWELSVENVYIAFMGYVSSKWEIKLTKDKEVFLFDEKKNYVWSYENDILKFKLKNQGYFNNDINIKFIERLGNSCFKVLYDDIKAKMCKISGGLAEDKNKAIKIEIR